MKVAGIISEYNPFHNGHKYQIDMLKKEYDAVVSIMSGSFVQRGDVAIFDKWTRARAALSSGCDLVIELPVKYVLSSANGFASGAIDILSATGIVDTLSFGSESGDIEKLNKAADILLHETAEISEKIKSLMDNGFSYPKARQQAYSGIIDGELFETPNNILALEYILELKKQNSNINPTTHKRSDNGYHSMKENGAFASATKIRDMIEAGQDISDFVPYSYKDAPMHNLDSLTDIFKYILLCQGTDAFSGIADVESGLDNRFLKNINKRTISEIIDSVKTKRYTRTRLQRIVLNVISGLSIDTPKPEYVRVLGMTRTGMEILSEMKKTSRYPIVNKVADFDGVSINADIRATDLASICCTTKAVFGRDYTTSPIIL